MAEKIFKIKDLKFKFGQVFLTKEFGKMQNNCNAVI